MRIRRLLIATATVVCTPLLSVWLSSPAMDMTTLGEMLLPSALAQPSEAPAKPDYAAAKKHYGAAEAAAEASLWSEAAKEYGIAYEITRDPVLFFKLGNAYQLSGDCTRAVEYFDRYLAEAKPSEEYQADTKSRISTCQSSMAAAAKAGAATQESGDATSETDTAGSSPLEPSLTDDGHSSGVTGEGDELVGPDIEDDAPKQPSFMDEQVTWQKTAAWTSVGVSVAFLTASAVLGLSASSREEDIDNLLSYRDASGRPAEFDKAISDRYTTLADEGDSLNTMSMIALGGAGISAAAAIVFFVIDDSSGTSSDEIGSLTPTIGNRSVGVRLHF